MKKQTYFFREALLEQNESIENIDSVQCNHENATCSCNNKTYRLIFPYKLKNIVDGFGFTKTINYNFIGNPSPKRDWIKDFRHDNSFIHFTKEGRAKSKGYYDPDYYRTLCKSKFTLCPEGDFLWTYRFYEAILCKSIPIVKQVFPDYHNFTFYYYYAKHMHVYDSSIYENNYEKLLRRNFINDQYISI